MNIKVMAVLGLAVILSGCGASGTKFFINNYENKSVSVQYKYYNQGQYSDSLGFDYAPKSTTQVSKEILPKKVLRKYPFYNSKSYFDSLTVNEIKPLTYQCQIPSNSTMYIAPIHKYGQSIEYLVLNNQDTIQFTQALKIKLIENRLAYYKNSFLGNSYFLLNLKLNEIGAFLKK